MPIKPNDSPPSDDFPELPIDVEVGDVTPSGEDQATNIPGTADILRAPAGNRYNVPHALATWPSIEQSNDWMAMAYADEEDRATYVHLEVSAMANRLGFIDPLKVMHSYMGLGVSVDGRGRQDVKEAFIGEERKRSKLNFPDRFNANPPPRMSSEGTAGG